MVFHDIAWSCIVLHSLAWYCTVLHGIAWYCMVLHCIAWYCMVLHDIARYCMVWHGFAWYGMVLHGIALYCMVLHGIAWNCMVLHHLALSCTILHYLTHKVKTQDVLKGEKNNNFAGFSFCEWFHIFCLKRSNKSYGGSLCTMHPLQSRSCWELFSWEPWASTYDFWSNGPHTPQLCCMQSSFIWNASEIRSLSFPHDLKLPSLR